MKTENDHINLKVAGQDGSVVQFKIKRHTPLSKLMKAYCERQVSFYSKCLKREILEANWMRNLTKSALSSPGTVNSSDKV